VAIREINRFRLGSVLWRGNGVTRYLAQRRFSKAIIDVYPSDDAIARRIEKLREVLRGGETSHLRLPSFVGETPYGLAVLYDFDDDDCLSSPELVRQYAEFGKLRLAVEQMHDVGLVHGDVSNEHIIFCLRSLSLLAITPANAMALDEPVLGGDPTRDLEALEALISGEAEAIVDDCVAPELIVDENVQFTVYRPKAVAPVKWCPLLVFAHLDERRDDDSDDFDPIAEVKRRAAAALGDDAQDYGDTTTDSAGAVPRMGELTFVPEVEGVVFNPPRQTILWIESVHEVAFRMQAGAALDGTTARGRMSVFLGGILLADVNLRFSVTSGAPERAKPTESTSARPYRKIFASYSHRDTAVVEQFEAMARALGDRYLRDWKDLRAGEQWGKRLAQMIGEADVFQLFWSSASMSSAFVRKEWEHALSLGREHFVRPVYWENPMPTTPGLPPLELSRLHFQRIGGEDAPDPAASAKPVEIEDDGLIDVKALASAYVDGPVPMMSVSGAGAVPALSANRFDAGDMMLSVGKSPRSPLFYLAIGLVVVAAIAAGVFLALR
jgi:hypothetical protein